MKDYPSIAHAREYDDDLTWYVFDKLDGSNIRAEWSKKQGFYKFGSRSQLLATDSGVLNEARELVLSKFSEALARVFREERYESAVAFFEFTGPSSFAGSHVDEPHSLTLLDVSPYRKGILPPREFVRLFGDLGTPALLHQGSIDEDFITQVREGHLEGVTAEGVVCKAKADRKTDVPVMFKIKTRAWLERLRAHCHGDQRMFDQLK